MIDFDWFDIDAEDWMIIGAFIRRFWQNDEEKQKKLKKRFIDETPFNEENDDDNGLKFFKTPTS